MKIGLIDVDGHRWPNLCLMKLSAYHKARGDCVEWHDGRKHYDLVYMSRVFTDSYSKDFVGTVHADRIIRGGTGYGLDNRLPDEIEHAFPDYSIYPQFSGTAYGFLTRGCPRGCGFCIVAKKEGRRSIAVADLREFWNGEKEIKLLDAAMDGTVTAAAYDSYYGNYVVIEDDAGYCTKYAHMDTLSVSAGQTVKHGDGIGTTGNTGSSTGSHLHIECLFNGEYYNPLFYFEAGEGTLYGETPGGGNIIPPDAYDDAQVQALMEEAAKYLGYPYVWGGSSPSTSFDCSGFVCWVMSNSGVHDLPRTTAQGIYDQCGRVSASDAKPGDIIFFTGTYNSAGPVSHVGIYCGDGVMIHCGDPIQYELKEKSHF